MPRRMPGICLGRGLGTGTDCLFVPSGPCLLFLSSLDLLSSLNDTSMIRSRLAP
jgi:hypothetical protein